MRRVINDTINRCGKRRGCCFTDMPGDSEFRDIKFIYNPVSKNVYVQGDDLLEVLSSLNADMDKELSTKEEMEKVLT